jgi:hypothetical protein
MAEAVCVNHPDVGAVGKCSQCKKLYCLDCLDLDTGKPVCKDCLAGKSQDQPAAPAPPAPVEPPPVIAEEPPPSPEPVIEEPVFEPAAKAEEETAISLDDFGIKTKEPEEIKQPSFKVTGNLAFMDSPSEPNKPIELEVKAEPPLVSKVTGPLSFMDSPNDLKDAPQPAEAKKEMPAFIPPKPAIPSVEEKPKAAADPFVFQPMKSMDNDPLGLFKSASTPPAPAASQPAAPKPIEPVSAPAAPKPSEPLPVISFPPMPDFDMKKPAHVPNVDMAGMMKKLETAERPRPSPPSLIRTRLFLRLKKNRPRSFTSLNHRSPSRERRCGTSLIIFRDKN